MLRTSSCNDAGSCQKAETSKNMHFAMGVVQATVSDNAKIGSKMDLLAQAWEGELLS